MSELSYKTRAGTSPNGKPRVYFTCAPGDFDRYFDVLSEDVLKHQNCAVWYRSPSMTDYESEEEMEMLLGQMQLFIIPVTGKLLESSRLQSDRGVTDAELAFAEHIHIPVLPVVVESEAGGGFSGRFGDIQYLDRNNRDATAIDYDTKLGRYLGRILTGDGTAERIRNEFDACIFMSYRKKDRQYACELMRMIHAVPELRDIAIWYDEYLVPGENFNDNIAEMLRKSDVFGMVVTPNLINEKNYVHEIEYPMARREGKKIIPMEMEKTDLQALYSWYEGIPTCIAGGPVEKFGRALRRIFSELNIEKGPKTPEHDFLIGLAYLNGVDVEVNFVQAVSLITAAAGNGLVEAMENLAVMYHEGKGVARDYSAALAWRKEAADALRKSDDRLHFFYALCELYDAYTELSMQKEAAVVSAEMAGLAEDLGEEPDPDFIFTKYTAWAAVGKAAENAGAYEAAEQWYLKSNSVLTELAGRTGVFSYQLLMAGYNRLGEIALKRGDEKKADEWFRTSLQLNAIIGQQGDDHRRELADSCFRKGDIERNRKNYSGACELYRQGFYINLQLYGEKQTEKALRDLSVGYEKLGDGERFTGRLHEAAEHYREGREISEKLFRLTGEYLDCKGILAFMTKEGHLYMALGKPDEAEEQFRAAYSLAVETAGTYDLPEAEEDICMVLSDYTAFEFQRRNYEHALELCTELAGRRAAAAELMKSLAARKELLKVLLNSVNIAYRMGEIVKMRDSLEHAFRLLEDIGEEKDTDIKDKESLLYGMQGELDCLCMDKSHARSMYRAAAAAAEETAAGSESRKMLPYLNSRIQELEEYPGENAENEAKYGKAEQKVEQTRAVERKRGFFSRLFRRR